MKWILTIHWKYWWWSWNSNTLTTWYKELSHWQKPRCSERLKVGEGDDRGWDGWKALPRRWTWVWVCSGSWWWTGKPGVLQSMSWQRDRHGWATKLNWICRYKYVCIFSWVTNEDFPGSSEGKESASNAEDPDLIPWLERSPGEGNGNPLQYSCLENFMDRGAWQCTVPGVTKSVTWLSD